MSIPIDNNRFRGTPSEFVSDNNGSCIGRMIARTVTWLKGERDDSPTIRNWKLVAAITLAALLALSIIGIIFLIEGIFKWNAKPQISTRIPSNPDVTPNGDIDPVVGGADQVFIHLITKKDDDAVPPMYPSILEHFEDYPVKTSSGNVDSIGAHEVLHHSPISSGSPPPDPLFTGSSQTTKSKILEKLNELLKEDKKYPNFQSYHKPKSILSNILKHYQDLPMPELKVDTSAFEDLFKTTALVQPISSFASLPDQKVGSCSISSLLSQKQDAQPTIAAAPLHVTYDADGLYVPHQTFVTNDNEDDLYT